MAVSIVLNRKTTPVPDALFRRAVREGLLVAGNRVRNAVVRALRGGYRSSLGNRGDFVTGTSLNHVRVAEPVIGPTLDTSYVRVGTDLLYNLYWEVGHHNIFTRRFERDERWRPAFRSTIPAARAAMYAAFKRVIFGRGSSKPSGAA